jgi:hypothetical protein
MAPLLTIKFGGTHLWYSKIRGVHVSVEHSKLILWCDVEFIEFFFLLLHENNVNNFFGF